MRLRLTVIAPIVLVIAAGIGCSASVTGVPTSTAAASSDTASTDAGATAGGLSYDTSATAVVIRLYREPPRSGDSSTQQSASTTTIYGDGRIVAPGQSVGVPLSPVAIQNLLTSADRRGLLDDPDLGPKVYDGGALLLTITVAGRTTQLELSGGSSTLTETQRAARNSFTAFVAEVAASVR